MTTWQTLPLGGWLQHSFGARVQGRKNGAQTKSRTPSAAARQEKREQEGMKSTTHMPGGELNKSECKEPVWIQDFIGIDVSFFSFGRNCCISVFPSPDSLYCFKKKKKKKPPTLYSVPPSFIDLSFHLPFPSRLFTLLMRCNKRQRKGEGPSRAWNDLSFY